MILDPADSVYNAYLFVDIAFSKCFQDTGLRWGFPILDIFINISIFPIWNWVKNANKCQLISNIENVLCLVTKNYKNLLDYTTKTLCSNSNSIQSISLWIDKFSKSFKLKMDQFYSKDQFIP